MPYTDVEFLGIKAYSDHPEVYTIAEILTAAYFSKKLRKRKLKQVILKEDEEGAESESYEFTDPFQGKNDRYTYPGARCLFNNIPQTITFQIHRLTLTKTNGDEYLALVPIIKMPLRNGLLMELQDDNVLLDDGFISESD